jgi:hypothetical protein
MDNYTIKTITSGSTGFNIGSDGTDNCVLKYNQDIICKTTASKLRNLLDMTEHPIDYATFSKYLALNGFNDLINSLVIRNYDHYSMISFGITDSLSISIDSDVYKFSSCSITEEVVGEIESAINKIGNNITDNEEVLNNKDLIGNVVTLTEKGNISDYVSFENELKDSDEAISKEVTEINNRFYFVRNTISTEMTEGFKQPSESIDNFIHFSSHVKIFKLVRVVNPGDVIDLTILYNDTTDSSEYPFTAGKIFSVPENLYHPYLINITKDIVASVSIDRIVLRSLTDTITEIVVKNCRLIKK